MTTLKLNMPTGEVKLSKNVFKKEMKKNRGSEFYAYFEIMSNKYLATNKAAHKFLLNLMTKKDDKKRANDSFRRYNKGLNKKEMSKAKAAKIKYNSKTFIDSVNKEINVLDSQGMYNIGKMRPENMLD